jgi:hypothetical protein
MTRAPFPALETTQFLTKFVATTVTHTLEPKGKLIGDAQRVVISMVQLKAVKIGAFKQSQFKRSLANAIPSDFLIWIV